MNAHKFADLFPMMEEAVLNKLAEDIKANGQEDPIITLNGEILDGRNRFKACEKAGVEPRLEEYTGNDPLQFVLSKNLERRHMSESQLAMLADDLITAKQGSRTDLVSTDTKSPVITRKIAAKITGAGEASIGRARAVKQKGIPALNKAVRGGKINVAPAAAIASLPKEKQAVAMEAHVDSIKAGPATKHKGRKSGEIVDAVEWTSEEGRTVTQIMRDYRPCLGMEIATRAIATMGRIGDTDKQFESAYQAMLDHCEARISKLGKRSKTPQPTPPSAEDTPSIQSRKAAVIDAFNKRSYPPDLIKLVSRLPIDEQEMHAGITTLEERMQALADAEEGPQNRDNDAEIQRREEAIRAAYKTNRVDPRVIEAYSHRSLEEREIIAGIRSGGTRPTTLSIVARDEPDEDEASPEGVEVTRFFSDPLKTIPEGNVLAEAKHILLILDTLPSEDPHFLPAMVGLCDGVIKKITRDNRRSNVRNHETYASWMSHLSINLMASIPDKNPAWEGAYFGANWDLRSIFNKRTGNKKPEHLPRLNASAPTP